MDSEFLVKVIEAAGFKHYEHNYRQPVFKPKYCLGIMVKDMMSIETVSERLISAADKLLDHFQSGSMKIMGDMINLMNIADFDHRSTPYVLIFFPSIEYPQPKNFTL